MPVPPLEEETYIPQNQPELGCDIEPVYTATTQEYDENANNDSRDITINSLRQTIEETYEESTYCMRRKALTMNSNGSSTQNKLCTYIFIFNGF